MATSVGRPVRIEVTDILVGGECPVGIEPGDAWEVRDGMLPEGMCASAWASIQHYVFALRAGGTMPWSGEAEVSPCCPDSANPVVFRIMVIEDVEE